MTDHVSISSFPEIIDLWPNTEALAKRLGENGVTVRNWRNRGKNIPPEYWTRLLEIAKEDGKPVTAELLMHLAEDRRRDNGAAA